MRFPLPDDDERRVRALEEYRILDTGPEDELDGLTRLASEICGTPIALISLVDRERQWFKSVLGLSMKETPRHIAFCGYAILQDELLIVPDATRDARFADNPLVTLDPRLRFYAGTPLRGTGGAKLGTLCVLDHAARTLTEFQRRALTTLGLQVEMHLELRLKRRELALCAAAARRTAELERDHAVVERERFFELSIDPMCVIDHVGRLARANAALCDMLGYRQPELAGYPIEELFHIEDRHMAAPFELARGLPSSTRFEARCRARDGSYRWVGWTMMPGADARCSYAIARDLTEQKRTEAERRHAQKMEALGRIAGGIAHDFNNLLSIIMMTTNAIDQSLPHDSPVRDEVSSILQASESAAQLTRQLLMFVRKQNPGRPQRVLLSDVLSTVGRLVRRVLGPSIALSMQLADDCWPVLADASQLQQVIMNLALNARDAMPNGGTLTFAVGNVAGPAADWLVLRVTDTGVGMDEATKVRIFEPFFTTKPAERGTGLGLATVFSIVSQSGGDIEVESELGLGTTFSIRLPRAAG